MFCYPPILSLRNFSSSLPILFSHFRFSFPFSYSLSFFCHHSPSFYFFPLPFLFSIRSSSLFSFFLLTLQYPIFFLLSFSFFRLSLLFLHLYFFIIPLVISVTVLHFPQFLFSLLPNPLLSSLSYRWPTTYVSFHSRQLFHIGWTKIDLAMSTRTGP